MSTAREMGDAPFSSRRGYFGGLAVLAGLLGVLVVVDVLPLLNPPPPEVEGKPLLPRDLAPIEAIEMVRGRKDFRLERTDQGWEMIDHGERSEIGSERVESFLGSIRDLVGVVEIGPAAEVSLDEFGLSDPRERITLTQSGGAEIQILLGDRNPPLTGIYIEVLPGEHVVLVGAVLLLEMDQLAALASAQAP